VKARLHTYWEKLHTSFWFVPTAMILATSLAAAVTLLLDGRVDEKVVSSFPLAFQDGVEGARSLLSAVAAAMMTVTGVTFSVTIVAFTLASSQFSPRLLRNFMRDLGNQVVLGTMLATFCYCLLVLRVVGGPSGDFIPRISVTFAFFLTLVSLCAMVYFIHHASSIIQAQCIVADVARELDDAIDNLYPEEIGLPESSARRAGLPAEFEEEAVDICATRSDYLEAIDGEGLLALAEMHGLVLSIEQRPGDFVGAGEILVRLLPGASVTEEISAQIRNAFILGPQRTQTQDLEFVLTELVEIAVRALSPGINDPMTAMLCTDRLGAALAKVAARPAPSARRYSEDGQLRIVAKHYGFRGLADAAFNQIRQYSRASAPVTIRLLEAIRLVALHIRREEDAETLRRHATMIERGSREGLPEPFDREDVQERFRSVLAVIDERMKAGAKGTLAEAAAS
jgi:uncharacterized membrane protein